jgi:hypothetical protein
MSPRDEVFQAVPFDGSYDAKEPLVTTGDTEEEDQGLEERDLTSFKLSSLLLGLILGCFFFQFAARGAKSLAIGGTNDFIKSNTSLVVFTFLLSLFTAITLVLILVFIRNLVAITYSAAGGHSDKLLKDMIFQLECHFGVGAVAGMCLVCGIMDVLLGTRVHVVGYLFAIVVFAFI